MSVSQVDDISTHAYPCSTDLTLYSVYGNGRQTQDINSVVLLNQISQFTQLLQRSLTLESVLIIVPLDNSLFTQLKLSWIVVLRQTLEHWLIIDISLSALVAR